MIKPPHLSQIKERMSLNLDKIDDMAECCDIMKSFGLSTKGIKTLDEMKAKLTKHLKDLKGTSTRKVGEVSSQQIVLLLETRID